MHYKTSARIWKLSEKDKCYFQKLEQIKADLYIKTHRIHTAFDIFAKAVWPNHRLGMNYNKENDSI